MKRSFGKRIASLNDTCIPVDRGAANARKVTDKPTISVGIECA
ncbi:MAG TPA: hypothetical protein PLY50_05880 [Burkholderiaceae bacterium]|nr:hypothetical protein [Burkholderiaceae bacterium]